MSAEVIGRHAIEVSHPDKLLFPEEEITKRDLIDYYESAADAMLPHARNRPITLRRFPDGIREKGFYQQNRPKHFPSWIKSQKLKRIGSGKQTTVDHVLCNDKATLIYLANLAAISLHGWTSRVPRVTRPDRLVFDLDPPGGDFEPVRQGARRVAELMKSIRMNPYVMTTGSRGLHVVAPIRTKSDFDATRAFAKEIAEELVRRHPGELTTEQRKTKRRGRLYLDVMRNVYGQTAVLPYSVRARPGAPVAIPLDLEELANSKLHARIYHIGNLGRRLGKRRDPWANIARHATCIKIARDRLARRRSE